MRRANARPHVRVHPAWKAAFNSKYNSASAALANPTIARPSRRATNVASASLFNCMLPIASPLPARDAPLHFFAPASAAFHPAVMIPSSLVFCPPH
ncbi:hypothetical protein [Deinococcus alpinitundrae]|uniref:hypothetical protein n=1 Tax=Deinococcus alpinitundrae TaxID=468913 RepID=UPI00137A36D3|nr:hypothetical protein [Deinococcus alpinitundrae]